MIGKTLKQYKIEDTLGKGGMGVVYRAQDTRLDRPVALKVLSPEFTADEDRRRRFLQEARTAGSLSHPAIAQIYDVDEVDGVTFIAMEFVEGKTVRQLIMDRELDLQGAVEIAIQAGEGLAKAHDKGIVHRDIKSDNIMVTRDGHAKILDFGLAKLVDSAIGSGGTSGADQSQSMMETIARTQAGMVLGTMAYMSPEQARGQDMDHRSDIFSFGIVLYEMVTGELPFQGTSPIDTLHAIAFNETRPVTTIRTNLPSSLHRVVSRCLRKQVQDRYQTSENLVTDLKSVQKEVDSGISQRIPLQERLRDGMQSLKDLTPGEWIWPVVGVLVGLAVLYFLFQSLEAVMPIFIVFGLLGLCIWRRLRNRRHRLMKQFAAKVKKMPEVRIIIFHEDQATVLADKALARTYVRINALMDRTNRKKYFGEPYSVVVRDLVPAEEERQALSTPGVLYVRKDVLGEE
jgi:predicted Ser/Thr protein kinase